MDPRLVKAQEAYRKGITYANQFTYEALQHIPKLIRIIIALEKTNHTLTELISLETLDAFDGKEEG